MDDILVEAKTEGNDYILIPITKSKANIEVCVDDLPAEVYREVLVQGLKVLLNRGMGEIKTTGLKDKELATAQKIAMDKAEENLERVYSGKIRRSAASKAKGLSREVKTEAMRLARALIKDAIKRGGGKISHYPAKEITALAAEYLEGEGGKVLVATAEANVNKLKEEEKSIKIDVSSIKADPELVKKAEAKAKAKAKPGVTPKAKPQAAPQHAAH